MCLMPFSCSLIYRLETMLLMRAYPFFVAEMKICDANCYSCDNMYDKKFISLMKESDVMLGSEIFYYPNLKASQFT